MAYHLALFVLMTIPVTLHASSASVAGARVPMTGQVCDNVCQSHFREYSFHSLSLLAGRPIHLPADALGSPDAQRILFLPALNEGQANLVKKLAALSIDPELVNTKNNVEGGVDQIEIGAFRFVLNNGREIYDIHTSHNEDRISNEAIISSFERILKVIGAQLNEVTLVEYYHVHPWFMSLEGGLSSMDANFIKSWLISKIKSLNGNRRPPVNLYAISQTLDKHLFVYKSTY